MSRILRRPMFRGGRVSSYGTGIASGLADGGMPDKRGLVTGPGGYAGWEDLISGKYNVGISGGEVPSSSRFKFKTGEEIVADAMDKTLTSEALTIPTVNEETLAPDEEALAADEEALDILYTGHNWAGRNVLDQIVEKEVGSEGDVVDIKFGDIEPKEYKTDEQIAIEKDYSSGQTGHEMEKESIMAGMIPTKKKSIGDLEIEKLRAEIAQLRKDGMGGESIDIDKETYLKALGGDKARAEDISTMLMSASSKLLGEGATVKSAFSEFLGEEAKRPSKRKSLEEAAAMLAIKDFIAGKRSKESLDQTLALLQVKTELGGKNLAEHIREERKTSSGVKAIKGGVQAWKPGARIEEVTSTEGLEFGAEDEGVIFIETDTKDVYTIKDGAKVPLYTG